MSVLKRTLGPAIVAACIIGTACGGGGGSGDGGGGGDDGGPGATDGTTPDAPSDRSMPSFGGDAKVTMGDGSDAAMTCGADTKSATAKPLDIYIMLDKSGSMYNADKWGQVTKALSRVVADPRFAGLGVGLQYFPLPLDCELTQYAAPAVEIAALPDAGAAIADSLTNNKPAGLTPMVEALSGAVSHVESWLGAHPDHESVVVLATDGYPEGCAATPDGGNANDLAGVEAVASAAAAATPPVKTFVIGVGSQLTALNDIAAAGGTSQAILVDTTQDTEQLFVDALDKIRKLALPCTYEVPTDEAGTIDFDKVNVAYASQADGGGASVTFGYVGTNDKCATATNGWYYDDPNHPHQIQLCDAACKLVREGEGRLDILYGCSTIMPH